MLTGRVRERLLHNLAIWAENYGTNCSYFSLEVQQSEQGAVGTTADPKIGSFGDPEGYTQLWSLRPTRERSGVDGRHPAR
ncbi:Hypothetical predicted protein [Pelobates cultripes]|uniref:Uncharacterized protein n=1 Tax=Pelobates cultripes TaxID=61616 RepID=A0AAD1S995_PELCU|nr:Hypothetical predicted protein [Pelobates cultripes]